MTGAILPGATVIVTPREPAGAAGVTVTANDAGVATVPGLKPGRYTIKAEFAGFDAFELPDVRLRAGDNKQQIELELTGVHRHRRSRTGSAGGGRRIRTTRWRPS